jgi:hypothetical protein
MKAWKDKEARAENTSENTKNNLVVSPRQLSFVVAGNIILLFTTFIFGYFWGQKYAAEQFIDKIHHESFTDQISSSLLALQEANYREEIEESVSTQKEDAVDNKEMDQNKVTISASDTDDLNASINYYYAQLIGFGTLQAANRFVNRLQQKNIPVEVKKRVSKTSRGKKIIWYQVVTKKYNDKFVLEKLVEILKKDEKLKDPCIIIC